MAHLSLSSRSRAKTNAPSATLRPPQIATLAGWGVVLWLIVALAIRAAPGLLFDRGWPTVALFALAPLNAWLTIGLTRRLFSLDPRQIVPAAVIASAAAMLCDCVALTWTTLYGPGTKDLTPVGALLLWGVANILIVALIVDAAGGRRGRQGTS